MPNPKLPPRAVDPDAKPKREWAHAHERTLAKIPAATRVRYETTVRLIEKICGDHARAFADAEKRGAQAPEPDPELVAAIAQFSTTGRLA